VKSFHLLLLYCCFSSVIRLTMLPLRNLAPPLVIAAMASFSRSSVVFLKPNHAAENSLWSPDLFLPSPRLSADPPPQQNYFPVSLLCAHFLGPPRNFTRSCSRPPRFGSKNSFFRFLFCTYEIMLLFFCQYFQRFGFFSADLLTLQISPS